MNEGIYEVVGGKENPIVSGGFFRDKIVRFILPFGKEGFLAGTQSDGIFLVSEGSITPWETPANKEFRRSLINRGLITPSGNILVGTILDGITLLDRKGRVIWKVNNDNGLQNNTVLGMFTDREENIWLALDRGIACVSSGTETGIAFYPAENAGAVYSAAFFDNRVYLGTNQGLYVNRGSFEKSQFELVPGTQGQVWDMREIDGKLVIGHNTGTFLLSNEALKQVSRVSGGFALTRGAEDSWWQCTYSNLVRYTNTPGDFLQKKVLLDFNELIRYLEFDQAGSLWASHMHRGIFRLRVDQERDSVRIVSYYGENSIFGKDDHLQVFKVENRVVFTTGEKLYTFDDLRDTLVSFDGLNRSAGRYAGAIRIVPAGNHLYWFITRSHTGLLKIVDMNAELVREYPHEIFGNQLIRDYENIIPMADGRAMVCLENGFAVIDPRKVPGESRIREKVPIPHAVQLSDQNGNPFPQPLNNRVLKIPYHLNSLHLRMAFPWYAGENISFSWHMEGLTQDWSNNGDSPMLSFERLPPGKYTLRAKVTDVWGNESQTYSIPVTVAPPWYLSLPARIFYLLLIIFLLSLFRLTVVRNTKKKERRETEEKEKELITLKNEKLQADISFKSRELANSAMSIIRKNELLLDLKEMLLHQKSQLGARFPEKYFIDLVRKIEDTLSSQDDWKVFDTNFEQAHEEFARNLKRQFPELTPKDMRLCAFLRMNLSSKEIAPLLGISIRGVENHRYRLRQKMRLEHDENLIEMILKL